jgi:hypothetical protein
MVQRRGRKGVETLSSSFNFSEPEKLMKIMKPLAAMAAALLVGGVANAQTSISHSNETVSNAYNTALSVVDSYTATSAFKISSIGTYNIGGSGQTIQIYKNGNLAKTVTGATGASGMVWSYATILNPLVVFAGDVVDVHFNNSAGTQSYGYAGGSVLGNFTASAKYTGNSTDNYATVKSTGLAWSVNHSSLSGTAVPEPGEWAAMGILGAGLTGLVIRKRRKV